jgi:hypothetical protein
MIEPSSFTRSPTAPQPRPQNPIVIYQNTILMSLPNTSRCSPRINGQSLSCSTRTPSHKSGDAAWNLADAIGIAAQSPQPVLRDPFTYYKAFLNTDATTSRSTNEMTQDDDGYTCHTGIIGARDVGSDGGQQVRARCFPYQLAVRLSDHSTGAPLATIMEQGSYSTLNSRGSLLSLGRFPSLRVAESHSSGRASHRISRSLDENSRQRIQEDAPHKPIKSPTLEIHAAASQKYARSQPICVLNMPIESLPKLPQSPRSQISDADHDVNNKRSNSFLRGVLQNVRAASRTRSRSSSSTRFEAREDRPQTSDSNTPCPLPERYHATLDSHPEDCTSKKLSLDSPFTAMSKRSWDAQARNRKIFLTNLQLPAPISTLPPLQGLSLPLHEQISSFVPVPGLLSPLVARSSREQPASVRLVTPEPRDVAHLDVTTTASTLSNRHNEKTSVQLAFHGVPTASHSASSLNRHDLVMQTSRNASFCSTMSTSYSGTVVGVDLDLHYDASQQVRRSSSPMPV